MGLHIMQTWMKCENFAKSLLTKCDELQDKTALHLKHLAELIDAPYMIHQIRKERNLDNEIASFVNKLKTKKYCHYRKDDEKEIQKADGIGYYSSILYIFKGNHIKQNYGNFFTYIPTLSHT
jgi:hypothetical protein